MIDDQTYNVLARGLAEQISCRAKGLDDESTRIVNVRPQEHILAGFLTPRSVAHPPPGDLDANSEPDDLPRDSAFELTSIGLEWLADQGAFKRVDVLSTSLSLNVYVRCTPTLDEQKRLGSWRREHGGGAQVQRTQPVIAVGRRLQIPEFSVEISVGRLLSDKRQKVDISPSLVLPTSSVPPDIYSARQVIYLTEPECDSEPAFTAPLSRARTRAFA